jgi:hypothetical protein
VVAIWPYSPSDRKVDSANFATRSFYKSGYLVEMAARPQTIGYSLTDTPVGLAAWMLDHYADGFEKISHAFLDARAAGEGMA